MRAAICKEILGVLLTFYLFFIASVSAIAEDRIDTADHANGETHYTIPVKDDMRHGTAIWYYDTGQVSETGDYAFGVQEGMWLKYHANGSLYEERPMKDGKLEGMYKEFYQDGSIKREIPHVFHVRDGASKWYHENGQVSEEGTYVDGVAEGMWKKYHVNGRPYEERPHVYGKLEGMYKEFYESGAIKREIPHTFHIRNGASKWYHENGRVSEEGTYVDGVAEGMWKKYHVNGRPYEERPHVYGKLEGMYKEFYESGAIKREIPHTFHIRNGASKWYHENGRVSEEGTYVDGVAEGMWKKYHVNGRPYEERPMKNGLLHGQYKEFYESGALKREIPHLENVRNGLGKWYGEDGKLTETVYYDNGNQLELASAESVDPETGEVTTSVENPDGSRTITKTDKNGTVTSREVVGEKEVPTAPIEVAAEETSEDTNVNLVSREALERNRPDMLEIPENPSMSATDPETGITTSSVQNDDGSRTVTKTDANGNIMEQEEFPSRENTLASGTLVDPETGEVTTVRTNADGTRSIVKSQVTMEDDGTEHTVSIDEDGNEIVSTITPDGIVMTSKTDQYGNVTDTVMNGDGSVASVERTVTGYTTETTRDTDGVNTIVTKDFDGSVMETVQTYPDGTTVTTDQYGNSIEKLPADDAGEVVTIKSDAKGNQKIIVSDEMGETLYSDEIRVTPKEPGREYYESVMGGDEWDELPNSMKTRYAGSERTIRENEDIEAKRLAREEEDRIREEADRLEMAALRAENDEKLAAIRAEQETANKLAAEREAKRARKLELQESYEKADRLQAEYDEAIANGDQVEANRIVQLQDEHEEASMEVLAFTEDEKKEMDAKTQLRQELAQRINREANLAALKEDLERTANDEYKDVAMEGASYLSIGAQQQVDLAKSNRAEDRLLSKAKNKELVIEKMLADPNLSADQRDILIDFADMSSLQIEGALEKKAANNRIVAAGYAIDAAMLASGGIGNAAAGVGTKLTGKAVAAKVATGTFVKGVSKGAGVRAAGEAAAVASSKVADDVAAKLMQIGKYDLKTGASKKVIEKAVTRATTKQVLARELEKGISQEVAEATAKRIGERAGQQVANTVGTQIAEKGLINVAASKGIGKTVGKMTSKETGVALEKALVKSRSVVPESVKNLFRKTAANEVTETVATNAATPRPVARAIPRTTPSAPTVRPTARATGMPAENVGGMPARVGGMPAIERASMPRGRVGGMGELSKGIPRGMPDGKVGGMIDGDILARPAGEVVTDPRAFGMLPRVMKTMQAEVNNAGLGARVRAANDSAIPKLRAGHPPKHVKLKSKTINDIDVQLGAPAGSQGEVGFFRPTKPKDLVLPDPPPNATPLQMERHSEMVAELTSNHGRLQGRYQQRLKEYGDNLADINKLVDDGLVSVENGVVVDRGLSNTRLGPDGKLRYNRNGPEGGTGKGFTGDHDMWDITHPDGSPIITDPLAPGFDPDALRRKIALQDALDSGLAQTQHGPHKDWVPVSKRDIGIDAKIRESHGPGGEALLSFMPHQAPMTSYEVNTAGQLLVGEGSATENFAARLVVKAANKELNDEEE